LLRWRLISAAVIISALLALVWLDYRQAVGYGTWLLPVVIAVSLLATEEVLSLLRSKNYQPVAWPIYLGNLLMPLAAAAPLLFELAGRDFPEDNPLGRFGWPLAVLALSSIAMIGAEMGRFRQPGTAIVNSALGIFTLTYVGLLVSFLCMLRLHGGNAWGMLALLSVLIIVKLADTGAYFFGRALGRTKMTPILSPGKTWEGAAGGVLTACFGSWACFHFLGPLLVTSQYIEPQLWAVLLYGLVIAVAGMHGDLAESLLKRDMQRKDSSTWLPGLGGVLDIIDSVLVAAPCGWLCWVLGLVGPG
jgi:phosphatidate cytidylyltransferase